MCNAKKPAFEPCQSWPLRNWLKALLRNSLALKNSYFGSHTCAIICANRPLVPCTQCISLHTSHISCTHTEARSVTRNPVLLNHARLVQQCAPTPDHIAIYSKRIPARPRFRSATGRWPDIGHGSKARRFRVTLRALVMCAMCNAMHCVQGTRWRFAQKLQRYDCQNGGDAAGACNPVLNHAGQTNYSQLATQNLKRAVDSSPRSRKSPDIGV